MCITRAVRAAIRSCWLQPNQSAARRTSTMVASPDQCTDQVVDGTGQRLKVSVVDPAGLDAPSQISDGHHPVAGGRRPPHRLHFDLPSVMLNDRDRLDSLDVALDNLHRSQPVGCGPAPFGCPRTAGRGTPLRHAAADLDDDRATAPAARQDLSRCPGGLAYTNPITRPVD